MTATNRRNGAVNVHNTINYGNKRIAHLNHSVQSTPETNVTVNNEINYNDDNYHCRDNGTNNGCRSIVGNITINNTVNYGSNSSDNNSDIDTPDNVSNNRTNLSLSYQTRRRLVRKLIDFIKQLGSTNLQAEIVSAVLNSKSMESVLSIAGILPPKEVKSYKYVVNQLWKQLERVSAKFSIRDRINDDSQSFRTNALSLLMPSPSNSNDHEVSNSDMLRLVCKNTSIPERTVRRLLHSAKKRRSILTKKEKDTTWSIIKHRNNYSTQQSSLYRALFEWVINHPHVISSPISRDTVLVTVPNPNGEGTKERVGKLLLEISVRELHQDLISPPPIGFEGAFCKSSKKLLISERYLRNVLPPQLRAMTSAQKQMCGCECCTITKMLHMSLVKFRKNEMLTKSSSRAVSTRSSSQDGISIPNYLSQLESNKTLTDYKPVNIINEMVCSTPDSHSSLPCMICVLGRCTKCPPTTIPQAELSANKSLSKIIFGVYMYHTKCKKHGLLKDRSLSCPHCTEEIDIGTSKSPEKIIRRKEITSMEYTIDKFHTQFYIPALNKYKYHMLLVTLLSKNYCKKMRSEAFANHRTWLLSERDYAERLVKELDGEIQSDHFGDNPTLSIEGCTLQYHNKHYDPRRHPERKKMRLDFHSHFADFSKQDAATTFEHMCDMFDTHERNHGNFEKNVVMLDHTDGCAKQYRSGNALYLLNVLCLKYQIVIDRAVCAPGHGKSIIDGLNAVDKHYLRNVMCMSGSNRNDVIETRMNMYAMTESSNRSFAKECARLCGSSRRKYGALSTNGRDNQKLSERFYYVQDPSQIRYQSISKGTKGFLKHNGQKFDGIQHHYNFRADPSLGHGFIASRRIPCACSSCVERLSLPWINDKPFGEQPRYEGNNDKCVLWNCLGPLNNWRLISFYDISSTANISTSSTTKSIFRGCLRSRAMKMSLAIVEGNYAAIATSDSKAMSGYYIACIRSIPYAMDKIHTDDKEKIPKGEMVCDIVYLYAVKDCHTLFYHGHKDETSLNAVIRIQHIIDANVKYTPLQSPEPLPHSMKNKFRELVNKNTIVIDDQCHDEIIEQIHARSHLEHSEYFESSEDSDVSDEETDDEF